MDLKQIEYFVHVAELGSFTRAAALLAVAQSAISRQVRLLEVELEQTLLDRNGRGVTSTEAGKRLLMHGRGILQQVERTRQELKDVKGAPVGHVTIGVPPSVGRVLTMPLVDEFRSRFPKAALRVVEGLTAYIVEWLVTGRVDIGLIHNPVLSPLIEISPLIEEPLYLICRARGRGGRGRPDRPVPLREMARYPLIIPSRPHAIRMQIEMRMANAGLKMNVAWEIDGITAILDLVRAGRGYAVMPIHAITGSEDTLVARPIVRPKLASVLALATPTKRPLTPLTRGVVDVVRELAPTRLRPA